MTTKTMEICPATRAVDHALAQMDGRIDWLSRLTPTNVDAIRETFESSGYRDMPEIEYEQDAGDLDGIRKELFALPVKDIENPVIRALMMEKQREVDRQIELVRMRGSDGFIQASIDLFGSVSPGLLHDAKRVLNAVPPSEGRKRDGDIDDILAAARSEIAWYRERQSDFTFEAHDSGIPGSSMYTSEGNFFAAPDIRVAKSRIAPLLAHEIGTHSITRYNGSHQPLHTLATGLADYDALQEGLAVLAEFLCGYFPSSRLRHLAGRVVAADMAMRREKGPAIFAALHHEYNLPQARAFSTTVRAMRGGGLTKDALYLKGLIELLAYLAEDGDIEILFLGKFAMSQLPAIRELREAGTLEPPRLLPRFLQTEQGRELLALARSLPVWQLYQDTPREDRMI